MQKLRLTAPCRQFRAAWLALLFPGLIGCQGNPTSQADLLDAGASHDARTRDARALDMRAPPDLTSGLAFQALAPVQVHIDGPVFGLALGDVNLDGKLDLLTGQEEDNPYSIGIFLGAGDGTFYTYSYEDLMRGAQPLGMVIGDFNNDGKPDCAIADATNGVAVMLGQGDGFFDAAQDYNADNVDSVVALAAGDVNGDGNLDLIVNNMAVLLGKGDGTFTVEQNAAGVSTWMADIALGDLNGDDKLDAVGIGGYMPGASGVLVLLGRGNGTFMTAPTLVLPDAAGAIAIADLNGDGKQDIVSGTETSVNVFLGHGDGTFESQLAFPVMTATQATGLAGFGSKIAVEDFNSDGHLDLVVMNNQGFGIMLGDGTGSFGMPQYFSINGQVWSIAVGDFTSDGKPDIALTGQGTAWVVLNQSQHP